MPSALGRIGKALLPGALRRRLKTFGEDERIFGRNIWTFLTSGLTERNLARGVLYSQTTTPLANVVGFNLSPTTAFCLLEPWRSWEQCEKVMSVRGAVFIEPRFGWVIRHPCQLVPDCVISPKFAPRPSLIEYLQARLSGGAKIRRERIVISLRDKGETNYWHFLNDILGRIRLIDRCGISSDIPLVVGQRAHQLPFFREVLERTQLAGRRIILQADEFIHADMVVYFQTARHSLDQIDFLHNLLSAPGGDPQSNRRVFLTRASASGRGIANMSDVERICRMFGFDVVDTEGMSVREQIELFSRIRYLIGIHGAGLTNLIWRRGAPMGVLEIFPPMSWRGHFAHAPNFFWAAHALGFDYDALFGREPREEASSTSYDIDVETVWRNMYKAFEVDARELSHRIAAMLQARRTLGEASGARTP